MESAVEKRESELSKITGVYTVTPRSGTWQQYANPKTHKEFETQYMVNTFTLFAPGFLPNGTLRTGLTDEQAREFEIVLNLKPMTLNPYNKEYWGDFKNYPKIKRTGTKLDCNKYIKDKLHFLMLKADPMTAMSEAELSIKPWAEWVLTSEEVEVAHKSTEIDTEKKAFDMYRKLNYTDQLNFLKVYKDGIQKSKPSHTQEFTDTIVYKIQKEDPKGFMDVLSDHRFKGMVFLKECEAKKAVQRKGSKYFTSSGDLIGNTMHEAIDNLNSPDYQEMKISLLGKMEAEK